MSEEERPIKERDEYKQIDQIKLTDLMSPEEIREAFDAIEGLFFIDLPQFPPDVICEFSGINRFLSVFHEEKP